MKIILPALLFLLSADCSAAKSWFFVNDSNDDVELSVERGEFQVGEQIMPSRFCGQKDDASCFSNDYFSFYIPRRIVSDEWVGNGLSYCRLRSFDYDSPESADGEIIVIATPSNGDCLSPDRYVQFFFFSKRNGLRHISIYNEKVKMTFFSLDRKGFGSGYGR